MFAGVLRVFSYLFILTESSTLQQNTWQSDRRGWSVSTTVAGNYVLAMRCCPWRQRHWMCDLILKRTRTEVMLALGDLILRISDATKIMTYLYTYIYPITQCKLHIYFLIFQWVILRFSFTFHVWHHGNSLRHLTNARSWRSKETVRWPGLEILEVAQHLH